MDGQACTALLSAGIMVMLDYVSSLILSKMLGDEAHLNLGLI